MRYLLLIFLLSPLIGVINNVYSADTPKYRRNIDYNLPYGKDTILYAVFMLEHAKWPKVTWVGISKYGTVIVLKSVGKDKYQMTPLWIYPHEIEEFFALLEEKIAFRKIKSHSKTKNEPYLISMFAGYALPSRASASASVFTDVSEKVEPLMQFLQNRIALADGLWKTPPQKGKGPHSIAIVETEDRKFLESLFVVMHLNETLVREK